MSSSSIIARRAAIIPRAVVAAHTQTPISSRPFSTTYPVQKVVPDSVKSGLKKVDRAVSDKIVVGIDAAVSAKDKILHESEKVAGKVEGEGAELKGKAKKAGSKLESEGEELWGEAKKTEGGLKGKAKKAGSELESEGEELWGKAKGKAAEAEGKVKSAAEKAKEKL